jgi:uncharacterized protein (DUF2249 family)
MTDSPPDHDARLDARDVDGEPFSDIVAALDDLSAGESLLLINGFEPEPLYDVLEHRGFDHDATRVGDDEWHVAITPA